MKPSRCGADYRTAKSAPFMYTKWMRRTSSGWAHILEPKRYKPSNASVRARLWAEPNGDVWLVRPGTIIYINGKSVLLAEGTVAELWDQFKSYGRMALAAGG